MPVKPAETWLEDNYSGEDLGSDGGDPRQLAVELARKLLKGVDTREQRLALAGALLRKQVDEAPASIVDGPETPDELWDYVYQTYGVKIARVAVCHDHSAPFDFFCAGFFEWFPNIFEIGPRGGGKSFKMALLHHLNSRFKPGCKSTTFGAVEEQSKKVYRDMVDLFLGKGLDEGESEIVGEPTEHKTTFKSIGPNPGSEVRCLPGTVAKVNGPHDPKVHSDEVEIMRPLVWREAQPVDTPVATPSGWRPIGDLEIGDLVFGRDGKPTQVVKVVDYGDADVYLVELTDGRTTECCGDHLWTVAGQSQRDRGVWKVMRTDDILAQGLKTQSAYRFGIPHGEPVEYEEVDHQIAPYVVGVMLGDGHIDTGTFVSSDPEIAAKVEGLLQHHKLVAREHNGSTRYSIALREWRAGLTMPEMLEQVGLAGATSHTKFIPAEYQICSRRDRLELLRGLMDTDGCAIEGSSVAQFATVSSRLARDVRQLVFGLGGRAILRVKNFKSEWSSGLLYTLDISFGDGTIPFSISRKVSRMTVRRRTLDPSIKSISPIGPARVRCIGVDNDDQTYRTTDYIVTHNSRNMAADAIMPDGRRIKAQNYGTSTMKWRGGRVHHILKQFLDVKRRAVEAFGSSDKRRVDAMIVAESQFYVFIHCIFEIAEQVPNCRRVPENYDLPEFDWNFDDTSRKCGCHMVRNGFWDGENGRPGPVRTLEDCCRGKLHRSRGHRSYDEIRQLFVQNDRATWEAQQECREGDATGVYIQSFHRDRHGIQPITIDPANGPIYTGTDWGATNPACVLWVQYLKRAVPATSYDGRPIVMSKGSRLVFAELYEPGLTSTDLGKRAIVKEVALARGSSWHRIPVKKRWADIQGAGDRKDWKKLGLKTSRYSTRNFDEHVKEVRGMYDALRAFVVVDDCQHYVDEIEGWRADEKGNEVEENNHAMAAGRYVFWGMHDVYDDAGAQDPELQKQVDEAQSAGPIAVPLAIERENLDAGSIVELQASEGWRANMGIDVSLL
jgi:hypothetical protein